MGEVPVRELKSLVDERTDLVYQESENGLAGDVDDVGSRQHASLRTSLFLQALCDSFGGSPTWISPIPAG